MKLNTLPSLKNWITKQGEPGGVNLIASGTVSLINVLS